MPSLAEELFERMLVLVPRRNLQSSYNKVAKDDILSVRHSVNDVLAAFKKLKEVRDAATKLEQDTSSTGGRNAGLLATMDSTLRLQKDLEICLEKWVDGMAMTPTDSDVDQKRGREETDLVSNRPEKQARLSRSGSDHASSISEAVIDISESHSEENERGAEESEAALRESRKASTGPQQSKTRVVSKVTGTIVAVTGSKAFRKLVREVNDLSQTARTSHIPDVIAVFKEWMIGPGHQSCGALVIEILGYLIAWFYALEGQHPLLELYRDCAKSVKLFAQNHQPSMHKAGLERQLKKLVDLVNGAAKHSSVVNEQSSGDAATLNISVPSRRNRPVNDLFTKLVEELSTKSFDKRKKRISELLVVFTKVTTADSSNSLAAQMLNDMNIMARWITRDPREPGLLRLYQQLVQAARNFANLVSDAGAKQSVLKQADILSDILAEKLSPKAQQSLKKIQHRAARFLTKLRGWKINDKPISKFEQVINQMGPIVQHVAAGWIPSQDPSIRKCIKILKECIGGIKPLKQRKRCEEMLASIKLD